MKKWKKTAIPKRLEGRPVLVVLKRDPDGWHDLKGVEYYGAPVVATFWNTKLKTTHGLAYVGLDDVERWTELELP